MRAIGYLLLVCLLVACAGKSQNRPQSQSASSYTIDAESFERFRRSFERQAENGEITWVAAIVKTRELDKEWARRVMFASTWKYDSDDEEYYAYCLALAERLDSRKISFVQYDAARLQKLNAINARRQYLNSSRPVQTDPSSTGVMCYLDREWISGLNKNCVYTCMGSEAVRTIGAAQVCPINVRQ